MTSEQVAHTRSVLLDYWLCRSHEAGGRAKPADKNGDLRSAGWKAEAQFYPNQTPAPAREYPVIAATDNQPQTISDKLTVIEPDSN
jgi:hypothetical protein